MLCLTAVGLLVEHFDDCEFALASRLHRSEVLWEGQIVVAEEDEDFEDEDDDLDDDEDDDLDEDDDDLEDDDEDEDELHEDDPELDPLFAHSQKVCCFLPFCF